MLFGKQRSQNAYTAYLKLGIWACFLALDGAVLTYNRLTQAWQGLDSDLLPLLPELIKCPHGYIYPLQGPWVLPVPSIFHLFSLVNSQRPMVAPLGRNQKAGLTYTSFSC